MRRSCRNRRTWYVLALLLPVVTASCDLFGPPDTIATVEKVAGDVQTDTVLAVLATKLKVQALSPDGDPVPDQLVHFRPSHGGVAGEARTDGEGMAEIQWQLGGTVGRQTIAVHSDTSTVPLASFSATAEAGALHAVAVASGDAQVGPAGQSLAEAVVFTAEDVHGNPKSGVPVTLEVVAGGGSVLPASLSTDQGGRAEVVWALGTRQLAQRLRATAGGQAFEVSAAVDTDRAIYIDAPDSASVGDTVAIAVRVGVAGLSPEVRGALAAKLTWDATSMDPATYTLTRSGDLFSFHWPAPGQLYLATSSPLNPLSDEVAITLNWVIKAGATGERAIGFEATDLFGAATFIDLLDRISAVGDVITIR